MPINLQALEEVSIPPQTTDPVNFPERGDNFLMDLYTVFTQLNSNFIPELNKIISGLDQAEPIAAWSAATSYSFPEVVAGSDGYSYRCIGTAVLNIDPTSDDGTSWVNIGSGSSIIGSVVISENGNATPRFLHILAANCILALPVAPQVNSPLSVINLSGTLTCVLNPGTEKINGVAEAMTVDILNVTINMIYSGSTYGWIVL